MTSAPESADNWPRILAVFATGVTAAFLIGKAPAALPVLRQDLGLTLFEAGLVVSMFSLIAAFFGVLFGALSDRLGQRRVAVTGLVVAAGAGLAGALAADPAMLIATRIGEGLGFFMMSVTLPGLIIRLANERNRNTAMGVWGAYLPLGAGLILLIGGGAIAAVGWRGLWVAIAVCGFMMLGALLWAAPRPAPASREDGADRTRVRTVMTTPGAVMLAVVFGCYSGQYMALTAFVPLILVERAGWTLSAAAAAGALVMVANTTGNLAAGLLLGKGFRRRDLMVGAAIAMAAGAIITMSEALPVAMRIAGAVLFASLGGMIPAALFAGVPRHAPSPAHISTVNGLMLQGVAIGQLVGPALTTLLVKAGGGAWSWSLFYLLPMAGLTALAAMVVGRIEDRT